VAAYPILRGALQQRRSILCPNRTQTNVLLGSPYFSIWLDPWHDSKNIGATLAETLSSQIFGDQNAVNKFALASAQDPTGSK